MLAKYTQVTKVDFSGCDKVTGEFRAMKISEDEKRNYFLRGEQRTR